MKNWPWWANLSVGGVTGAAVAVLLLRWTRIDHAAVWSADLALQGWGGAVIGAVASIGVAFWVLQRTLAHERRQFAEQLSAERDLAREQRRSDAFGQLAASLMRIHDRRPKADMYAAGADIGLQWNRWAMHCPTGDEYVSEVGKLSKLLWKPDLSTGVRREAITMLVTTGRAWHRSDDPELASVLVGELRLMRRRVQEATAPADDDG